jgi:hypothetical protein
MLQLDFEIAEASSGSELFLIPRGRKYDGDFLPADRTFSISWL